MDSEESSEGETFMRLMDEFRNKYPYSKQLLQEKMEKTLESDTKKIKKKVKVKNASNLRFKQIHKRIHEKRLSLLDLPLTLRTALISRIPIILSRPNFMKRKERRQENYDVWSFKEDLKKNVTSQKSFNSLYSIYKSRERKVLRSEVEGTKSPKTILEKPSAEIGHFQRKVKPKVISIKQVEDISETDKLLKKIREQKKLCFRTDLNNLSKTNDLEINNNENVSKPRETRYSKSNSTNSVSEKSFTDEFTMLGTKDILKIHQFRPLKSSTLSLSSEVDKSIVENMNFEKHECHQSRISAENTQQENESVDKISFVTYRKKCGSLKNSSLFLSKEDDRVVKSSSRTEFFESGFGKTQLRSESEKCSQIFSRRKIKISPKKRKMALEEKAEISQMEISDSERTTETLEIWNLKQQYGKDCLAMIAKRTERDPEEPVSDSERTTELLDVYLKQFRPLKSSTLSLSSEVDRSIVENTNLEPGESLQSRISAENTQQENESVDKISFVTYRKKCGSLKNSSLFLSKEDDRVVKSSSRTEFFESGFGKTQLRSESEKCSQIFSRRKIKISPKKRKMALEEKAEISQMEISDSEES